MWYNYTIENYSAIKIKGNPAICDNMNETGGHYTKWSKPDTKRPKLHDFTYI